VLPLCLDISLWSADLANLESEIRRLDAVADSYHLDAADGHYVRTLLFFPDLIAGLRELTSKEFHLHLMATRPMDLLPAFLQSGVNCVTLPIEVGKRVRPALEFLKEQGRQTGISIELDTSIDELRAYLPLVDTIIVMGTETGVKGCDADPRVYERISAVKYLAGNRITITADGGIRENTVPLLRAAGADAIVPGSLVCKAPDLAATAAWLKGL
jgi:ribulose-phosphate 3-epimerase